MPHGQEPAGRSKPGRLHQDRRLTTNHRPDVMVTPVWRLRVMVRHRVPMMSDRFLMVLIR
jgi:hypothetical protein